jgi:uncharacterized protein (DUF885 family)
MAPAIAAAPSRAGARDEIFRATLLWLASATRPFTGFAYGAISVDFYPVPYVVSQVEGAYQVLPDFLDTQHRIATRGDAEAYLDRLAAFGPAMDQQTAMIRADAARGAAPPGFLIDRTLSQLASFQTDQHGPGAGLVTSLAQRAAAKGITGNWGAKAQALVDGEIATATARQIATLESLRPGAREAAGVRDLPDGEAYYAACLKFHTTTALTPAEAHQLGLDEAARVSARARHIGWPWPRRL